MRSWMSGRSGLCKGFHDIDTDTNDTVDTNEGTLSRGVLLCINCVCIDRSCIEINTVYYCVPVVCSPYGVWGQRERHGISISLFNGVC